MRYTEGPFRFHSVDTALPLEPLLAKLRELADLPAGWRFGEGVPPRPVALHTARHICHHLADFRLKADVFPGADGSLSLVYYAGERCVEIYISQDGGLDLSVEEGEGFDFREIASQANASIHDAIVQVTLLAQKSHRWNSSGSSIHANTIDVQNASAVHASPILVTGQAYRWLMSNAFENAPHRYASTSNTIIRVS